MMRAVVLAFALASFTTFGYAQTPPPAEAFGRLPAIADAAISPDGRRVALAYTDAQGRSSVGFIDTESGAASGRPVAEDEQLRGVSWADDRHVLYRVSRTFHPSEVIGIGNYFRGRPGRVDFWRNGVLDIETNEETVIIVDERRPWNDSGPLIAPVEGEPGMGRLFGGNYGNPALYRVNLANGRVFGMTPQGTNNDTIGFEIDGAGRAYIRYDTDQRTNRWKIFVYDGTQPRLLLEDVSEYGDPISIAGLLPDDRIIASDRPEGEDFYRLFVVDRRTGERTPFYSREGTDAGSTFVDPWTRRIVGVAWSADRDNIHFFDPELQAVSDRLDELLPEDEVHIYSWSRDRQRFLLYIERGLDGGGFYLFDRAGERFRMLGLLYPDLQSASQGERQSITYRARDGVRIPAYVTYPAGVERRNLPLVLLVHGGPHARDTFGFDWWASFLASRGYVVLQANYRGSSGFGQAWEDAGRRQWGGLMQTDVEDGVAALQRAGIIDGNRVCIVGASYGGYAALAGATLTPDRYRCAASIAGVSDLERMLVRTERQTGGNDSMTSDWWRDSIGDREEDRARIRSVSPANLADRVQIPILLMHGTDDIVVPISQSRLMRDRLEAAGKRVRYVELSGDDHWLSDAATRTQMLRELETFLATYLLRPYVTVEEPPAATPSPAQ